MPRHRTTINFQAQTDALRVEYPEQPWGAVSKRFALLGMRPRLAGADDPCPHCKQWRTALQPAGRTDPAARGLHEPGRVWMSVRVG